MQICLFQGKDWEMGMSDCCLCLEPWGNDHYKLCRLLRTVSLFTIVLWILWAQVLLAFRARVLGTLWWKSSRLGQYMLSSDPLLLREELGVLNACCCSGFMARLLQPFLLFDKGFFSFACCSASFWISFKVNCAMYSCRLMCPWEEVSSRACYVTILDRNTNFFLNKKFTNYFGQLINFLQVKWKK